MDPTFFHVDLDAFFASVEQLDFPELRGKPIIIGGNSDRGVVATASYEARRFGIHSAMAIVTAKKRCPEGIFLEGRFSRYSELSHQVFDVISSMATYVEQVSIDEAYLDMTEMLKSTSDTDCGRQIKEAVYKETGLTLSVGIAYNKFLAKLASDWNKPGGLMRIDPTMMPDILLPLKISKIHGLGQKSVARLNRIGVFTVLDLYAYSEDLLEELIGKYGRVVYHLIRGVDPRTLELNAERKSYGKETTFEVDTEDKDFLKNEVSYFCHQIARYLNHENMSAKRLTLKYKTGRHESHTRSKTLYIAVQSVDEIKQIAFAMIDELDIVEPLRLIGLTVSVFEAGESKQLSVFETLGQ